MQFRSRMLLVASGLLLGTAAQASAQRLHAATRQRLALIEMHDGRALDHVERTSLEARRGDVAHAGCPDPRDFEMALGGHALERVVSNTGGCLLATGAPRLAAHRGRRGTLRARR